MDRFTRNAVIGTALLTGLLILSVLPWDDRSWSPRIWQLNELLKQDDMLAAYPYEFRALLFLNGIVTLKRPHDAAIPVAVALGALEPAVAGKSPDDPAMVAARDRLQRHEMRAIELMLEQPDVHSVIWSLDRAWLNGKGISLPSPDAAASAAQ